MPWSCWCLAARGAQDLVLALGVMVGDQQHQGGLGGLGRVVPIHPPSSCLWWCWGCSHWHSALAEDARSLLPPQQIPCHQKMSAVRG